MVTIKALGRLEVRRVQVLRPMREEVESWAADACQPSHPVNAVRATRSRTSHQKHSVDTQKPVLLEHRTSLLDETTGLFSSRSAVLTLQCFSANEDFALWHKGPNEGGKNGYARRGPKESAPRGGGVGNEAKVYYRCNEVSEGVSLLEDTRRKTTGFDGEVFECCR
jgi:hypothetical protein